MKDTVKYSKIVLTGGGTGGHVYPNLALVGALKKRFDSVEYIGSANVEKHAAAGVGLKFTQIDTVKLNREFTADTFTIPSRLMRAVRDVKVILHKMKPDAVFSKGGYVALPVVLAARELKIPVVCHESDLTLGLTNRISAAVGAKVLVAKGGRKGLMFERIEVGIPLRKELFEADVKAAKEKLNIPQNKKTVLIIGGSSGAKKLLDLSSKCMDKLVKKFFVIRVIGDKNVDDKLKHENLLTMKYSDDMPSLYAASDVVVSRAGATAVAEITALKKRAVFVPLSKGVSRGDQIDNARLAQAHGAIVLVEEYATPTSFYGAIVAAAEGEHTKPCYQNDADKIVNEIVKAVQKKEEKQKSKKTRSKQSPDTNGKGDEQTKQNANTSIESVKVQNVHAVQVDRQNEKTQTDTKATNNGTTVIKRKTIKTSKAVK